MIVGPLHLIREIQNKDSDSYKTCLPSSKAVSQIILYRLKLRYNINYQNILCAEYLKMYFTQWETRTLLNY